MFKHSENQLVKQSQRRISQALIKLLATEKFAELTVTQICQEAGVGRKTFYRNFDDKMSVIAFFLYDEMEVDRQGNQAHNIQEAMLRWYRFIQQQQSIFRLLYQNNLMPQIQRMLKDLIHHHQGKIEAKMRERDVHTKIDYFMNFTANTIYSNIELWISKDFAETPAELAELTVAYLTGSVIK